MKQRTLLLAMILFPIILSAQYGESIRTGRPGQAIGGFTLGKNVFQLQTGYTLNFIEDAPWESRSVVNSSVFRVGLLEKFELSAVVNWSSDKFSPSTFQSDYHVGGISNTQIGGRVNLLENDGWKPTVGLQGRLLLKLQDEAYRRDKMGAKFLLVTGNRINDRLSVITNWGITWTGNQKEPIASYVLNVSHGISDKFGTFLEIYGDFNDFNINYDTGLSYLVNKDFQLDISTGWQGTKDVPDWFVDFGLSWRFDWRK